jgi:hypothetical protein
MLECRALTQPTAGTVEELARLQLAAYRKGCRLELAGAHPSLLELIDFCGLTEVLRVEAGRQAEKREDPGCVEEECELPDPAA